MRTVFRHFATAALLIAPALVATRTAAGQGATSPTEAATASSGAAPQLVVLVTVDQLLPAYLERWAPQFTGGLARFWSRGAVFTNATHDHATTETAPGHATLGSGRFPRHTGIVRNAAGVQDVQYPLLDGGRGGAASPSRFRGSSLFDWMREQDRDARALSVSRKDRGAILPLGRARQSAYWYSSDGRFITSHYYADTLPTWVTAFNRRDFVGALDGAVWNPLLPTSAYPERDDVAVENRGREIAFPHALPEARNRRASALSEYPVMDSITLALALSGVEAMALGDGNSTDFLAVSLSTTDAVGHRYGPASREVHDQVLRVDRYLGQFMDSLFQLRDSSRVLFALSADHGVAPFPSLQLDGDDPARGVVQLRAVFGNAHSALLARGVSSDVLTMDSGIVGLDTARVRAGGVPVDSVIQAVRAQLQAVPGVMRVDHVAELPALADRGDRYARRWLHALPPDLDAVLTVTLEPYHYFGSATTATHGSPHDYDAHVPLMFFGPAFSTGHHHLPARTVDLAATLAAALGITPTEVIDGRPLVEALAPQRAP